MKFDTAIFYDIENLIGGYSSRYDFISDLSLKEIFDEIRGVDILGEIAIQRAYANWSHSKLSVMRGEIVELGIEPIQMFGFGKGATKNASDIQLAIDAVEYAITRPSIETFVIVSGDGGFSALAKKLHEYGKAVVGCAYKRAVNRVFEAVCDRFVWINHAGPGEAPASNTSADPSLPPILKSYSEKYSVTEHSCSEEMIENAKTTIKRLAEMREARQILETTGMNISVVSYAFSKSIKEFSFAQCGFARLVDFLRHVVHDTEFSLVHRAPSEYLLVMKGTSVPGFTEVETIPERPSLHSLEVYRLLVSHGSPPFRLADLQALKTVANYLVENASSVQNVLMGDLIEEVTENCDLEQKEVKDAIFDFVYGEAFQRAPKEGRISEQLFSLKDLSMEGIMDCLRSELRAKLLSLLNEIDENVFSGILD